MRGKKKRKDVAEFSLHFLDNILTLRRELVDKTYRHGGYQAFEINDSKPRDIHKASVRDRLVHHAVYRIMYPYFNQKFIFDSYSCRNKKGTHKAINRLRKFAHIVSKNNTQTCWILKCDIRKFFANIDHDVLKNILAKHIVDKDALWLLAQVIDSFKTKNKSSVGLPLGNLTSQLLVNIYLNEFDQFAKRNLKAKYYVRYCDDFIIIHGDKTCLENIMPKISKFLEVELKLSLHSDKVFIKTFSSGVDFLGWVNFSKHRILRTSTRLRMMKKLEKNQKPGSVTSYLGLLKHGNTHKLKMKLIKYA